MTTAADHDDLAPSTARMPWVTWAAYLVFLFALALPVYEIPYGAPWRGHRCAQFCAEQFLRILREPVRGTYRDGNIFIWGTISNLVMLLAPGLALVPPRRRRIWPAFLATFCAIQTLRFGISTVSGTESGFLGTYWVWASSFVFLAASLWVWEMRVYLAARHGSQP